jgi:hypothetical protein
VIHYHGGPITPDTCAIKAWKARHAFISFAAPQQIGLAAKICQSFALDNGAFSAWKVGQEMRWLDYYAWVGKWVHHPGFDFAVIPDVIDGTEQENDALLGEWPFRDYQGAPVWHINESFNRLKRLATRWPRVCIGSSGEFDVKKQEAFLQRAYEAIEYISVSDGQPRCKIHGLRMLNPEIFTELPLASADSTNVARNIGIDSAWKGTYQPQSKETRTSILVERIEHFNGADRLGDRPHQFTLWSQL